MATLTTELPSESVTPSANSNQKVIIAVVILIVGLIILLLVFTLGSGSTQMYSCINGECVEDNEEGEFESDTCDNQCPGPGKKWKCETSGCVAKSDGNHETLAECQNKCFTYECKSTGCVKQDNSAGLYDTESECESECGSEGGDDDDVDIESVQIHSGDLVRIRAWDRSAYCASKTIGFVNSTSNVFAANKIDEVDGEMFRIYQKGPTQGIGIDGSLITDGSEVIFMVATTSATVWPSNMDQARVLAPSSSTTSSLVQTNPTSSTIQYWRIGNLENSFPLGYANFETNHDLTTAFVFGVVGSSQNALNVKSNCELLNNTGTGSNNYGWELLLVESWDGTE